ncbi:hypothetical protein ABFS82_01G029400 [Erythranthe guttata]|uniref:Uncharacterized protein n=1 Tax=Erythranthe guttata TaxID=4155 RepID=A0A022Q2V2_ERYGU|nr:PREDICTED: uncharacterized protein LOC105975222 [Erythranthe guttata]EYU21939.1 hypothetical protein MIMGU_mgv1a014462mg [Erythranthe guttata]|eukprot:XP_012855853.1 PREDICTED: uncharacterized protein LOC105975222 [Erythranthe guttata]
MSIGASPLSLQFHAFKPASSRFRACAAEVPDFFSADWLESRKKRPFGPRLSFSAEEAVGYQLDALMFNDQPRPDYGIEVMYRFAGFDPFERSTYFGPFFDLGQFERFRRIFHHSSYRVLLGHKERNILSSLNVNENCYKQRVWVRGARPEEEEVFQFTMVQRVGGSWDGYWLTESVLHDGDSFSGGVAY